MNQESIMYKEFIDLLFHGLQERLGDEYNVQLNTILKNNSIHMDGIVIRRNEEKITPNIYLEEFYDDYENGMAIEKIIERITNLYFDKMSESSNFQFDFSFEQMKSCIIYRIVNFDKNKELLEGSPYVKLLDLAITFHCMVQENNDSIGTIRITNDYVNLWGISTKELMELAKENTRRLLPPVIKRMDELLKEIIQSDVGEGTDIALEELSEKEKDEMLELTSTDETPMYVLSNTKGINGATCLLYPLVVRNFARFMKSDLYILPSSIHEIILLPNKETLSVSELKSMVYDINRTQVPYEEILSDHIYYYSVKENKIKVL